MLVGKQTYVFTNKPVVIATGVSGGPFEAQGKMPEAFDILNDDLWMGEDSYEKAHRLLIEQAIQTALKKANLKEEDIQLAIGGDLINQLTPTNYALEKFSIPFLGIFSACATSMEGLALAAFFVNSGGAHYVLTGTGSHNAAAERQYRYPTEYGGQKPPTAQWTVTGAAYAIIGKQTEQNRKEPKVTTATFGRVMDTGITDPFNMGTAMAPAAADTISQHFQDTGRNPSYYDLIVTGDLAKTGKPILLELLQQKGINLEQNRYEDCGLMIYGDDQSDVLAGASGAAASAAVIYGFLLKQMKQGNYRRILCVATGSLHSPLSIQQRESIPVIAHAVSLEME